MKSPSIDQSATEEAGSQPIAASATGGGSKQEPREFLGLARRALSEDELATPAARRFLIAEIERLDGECAEVKASHSDYVDLKVENARLKEAEKKSKWNEILAFACSTLGAVGIGAAPSFITVAATSNVGWIVLVAASLLVILSVLSKIFK